MEKSEKKTDRRVIKTKKAIHMAFVKLLSQKSVNEITVKDIADEADINRKTFYNYYSGGIFRNGRIGRQYDFFFYG